MPNNPQSTKKWPKEVGQIMYHVLSWVEDEGEYQPTEDEAAEAIGKILDKIHHEAEAKLLEKVMGMMDEELVKWEEPEFAFERHEALMRWVVDTFKSLRSRLQALAEEKK